MRIRAAGALAPRVLLGVLAGGGLVLGWDLAAAPPAAATDVSTEEELRAAFFDITETSITLTADITLDDCGAENVERNSATPLTIDGGGRTVEQSCEGIFSGIFYQEGSGALTLTDITRAGGNTQGDGGAILSEAPVTVVSSEFQHNVANGGGGAISARSLRVVDSTFTDNQAQGSGGAIFAGPGDHVVSGSTFTDNSASALGGAIFLGDGALSLTVAALGGRLRAGHQQRRVRRHRQPGTRVCHDVGHGRHRGRSHRHVHGLISADSIAWNLAWVSASSRAGTLSATMPLPA